MCAEHVYWYLEHIVPPYDDAVIVRLLLDASKAFDRFKYYKLFQELLNYNVYTSMYKWKHSSRLFAPFRLAI